MLDSRRRGNDRRDENDKDVKPGLPGPCQNMKQPE